MKKLLTPALLFAIALSSCSKSEVTDLYPTSDNTNAMGLNIVTSVTRALDTQAQDIRDAGAVSLYYHNEANDGIAASTSKLPFVYKNGEWEQEGTPIKWSALFGAEDLKGKLTLFSMHYGEGSGAATTQANPDFALTVDASAAPITAKSGTFTPAEELADQYDLVYYTDQLLSVPANGNITATYHHALSRIETYCDLGTNTDYTPFVKSVRFSNVKDSGIATIINKDYDKTDLNITWDTAAAANETYTFFDRGATQLTGQKMVDDHLLTTINETQGSAITYPSTTASNAIIVPQTLAESTTELKDLKDDSDKPKGYFAFNTSPKPDGMDQTTADARPTYDQTYTQNPSAHNINVPLIYSLYRMSKGDVDTAEAVVGYLNVNDCVEFHTMAQPSDDVANPNIYNQQVLPATHFDYDSATGISTVKAEYKNAPLFVLAGFPLDKELVLQPNYDYDFYLGYGTTGGILMCDFYFFGDGTMTNIPIDNIDPGDTILPDENTPIGLRVMMSDWEEGGDHSLDGDDDPVAVNPAPDPTGI